MAEYIDRTQLETDTEWSEYYDDFISYSKSQINSLPTADVIPITDGATNGDMIKAMFPNAEIKRGDKNENRNIVYVWIDNLCIGSFRLDWWNTPYKKEVEE